MKDEESKTRRVFLNTTLKAHQLKLKLFQQPLGEVQSSQQPLVKKPLYHVDIRHSYVKEIR